ncbi:hypothetical protein FOL47_003493 [Perkinsus chesapeaki]|uniref:Uncharacterized protein n=1 Tax=Perkinsus chesapeaki TaxID=330153 RepID=A0A7J6M8N2_PERCH|nr:hypothetical protein FOL47_003493 [Perkinsus chesapeaki]
MTSSPRNEADEGKSCMHVHGFWNTFTGWLGGMCVESREVGVENRYYFDDSSKTWELRGGETEEDRQANRAIQTCALGELPGERPAWRAGAPTSDEENLPPPPTDTAVCTRQYTQTPQKKLPADELLEHPVYAPKAFAMQDDLVDPRPVHDLPPKPKPNVYSSPFGPAAAMEGQ